MIRVYSLFLISDFFKKICCLILNALLKYNLKISIVIFKTRLFLQKSTKCLRLLKFTNPIILIKETLLGLGAGTDRRRAGVL